MTTSVDQKRDLLCRAIADRHLVQFSYDGRAWIVEPFCCGISSAENYVLRGFQIRGTDKTKFLCRRLYRLPAMSQLSVTQHGLSGKREEYNLEDSAMTEVFCRIS